MVMKTLRKKTCDVVTVTLRCIGYYTIEYALQCSIQFDNKLQLIFCSSLSLLYWILEFLNCKVFFLSIQCSIY